MCVCLFPSTVTTAMMANLKLSLDELKLIATNINLADYKNMSKNQSERKFLIDVYCEVIDKLAEKIQTMSKNPSKLKLEKYCN